MLIGRRQFVQLIWLSGPAKASCMADASFGRLSDIAKV